MATEDGPHMIATGTCFTCGAMFAFNPHRVPSYTPPGGTREPICRDCMDKMNKLRTDAGMKPFEILEGAYEPEPCS